MGLYSTIVDMHRRNGMKLQSERHKEQTTYIAEVDWTIDRDRCNEL